MARPTDYTTDTAARICAELSAGRTLLSISAEPWCPDRATVYRWLAAQQEFRDMYARARLDQADVLAEEIIDIADSAEDAAKGRLQVDARKWYASKMRPDRYSDKVQQEHSGPNGGPIQIEGADIKLIRANPG